MTMKFLIPLILLAIIMSFEQRNFNARNEFTQADSLTGTWKGLSICPVKNSPCHDEVAIYHISGTGKKCFSVFDEQDR